jgi:hypothetical protein
MKSATRAPFFACLYHGLCDVARKHGYALAIHGTVTTDLDLIAVPWVPEALPPEMLKEALMAHIGACGYEDLLRRQLNGNEALVQQLVARDEAARKEVRAPNGGTIKPHGRLAWNLYLEAGAKVDLSILPRAGEGQKTALQGAGNGVAGSAQAPGPQA